MPVVEKTSSAAESPSVIELPGRVDADIVKYLEQLNKLSTQFPKMTIDFSRVKSIDIIGAQVILRVLQAYRRSSLRLELRNISPLRPLLRELTNSVAKDEGDAVWMLLLMIHQLMDDQREFEEAAIQYCIAYELSPPSWESRPKNITVMGADVVERPTISEESGSQSVKSSVAIWFADNETEFSGCLADMLKEGKGQAQFTIDCQYIKRIPFSVGSTLLHHVSELKKQNTSVDILNVNPIVEALFKLQGLTSLLGRYTSR